jgi:hypothetical protein
MNPFEALQIKNRQLWLIHFIPASKFIEIHLHSEIRALLWRYVFGCEDYSFRKYLITANETSRLEGLDTLSDPSIFVLEFE